MENECLNKWSQFPGCCINTINKNIKDKILDKTLNPNETDYTGTTLLLKSIQLNDLDMASFLLNNGVDPNKTCDQSDSAFSFLSTKKVCPLTYSFRFFMMDFVLLLLEKGANPNLEEGINSFTETFNFFKKK